MLQLAGQVIDQAESRSTIRILNDPYGPVGYDNVVDRRPDLTKLRELIPYVLKYRLGDMIADVMQTVRTEAAA